MAEQTKTWAYTTLAADDAVRLEIGDDKFEVVQWTASFAINQVPESMCMLALGRNARDVTKRAAAHSKADGLSSMKRAKVFFKPGAGSEFAPDGTLWPTKEQVIFEGYFVGFSYPKVNGKVTLVAHLVHWLVDMGFTSTLSAISHPENPESMTFPAIQQPFTAAGGVSSPGTFVSQFVGGDGLQNDLSSTGDLWFGLKNFMCAMSNSDGFNPLASVGGDALAAAGIDVIKKNNRAARALARIEGPGTNCAEQGDSGGPPVPNVDYKYAKPLMLEGIQIDQAWFGIANATTQQQASEMVHLTMWDALIGMHCPTFGIDLCPQIDRAQVVPSCPGFNKEQWRTITPDEYDYVDQTGTLPKPLRAVVAHGSVHGENGVSQTEPATSTMSSIAGAFGSTAEEDGDGAIIYLRVPPWIGEICNSAANAGDTTGVTAGAATPSATTPSAKPTTPKDKPPAGMIDQANDLLNQYARFAFIQNSLRGRVGTISGKLRFDIGPGSHLKVIGKPEQFIGAEDALATTVYGQVNRVTPEIDCEGRRASTSFVISHLRNEKENKDDRTSIDHHPLYGASVMIGSPLRPEYEKPDPAP